MKRIITATLISASFFATNPVTADEIPMEVRQQMAERTIELIAKERGVQPSEVKLFTDANIKFTIEKYGSGNEEYHYRYVPDQFEEDRRLRGNIRW